MSKNTKEKLLDAALDIFAEQGFKAATVQKIIERAGVNISAINYHFRDKANFYAEAVVWQIKKMIQGKPEETELSDEPEEQLRAFIHKRLTISCLTKRAQFIEKIMTQEMASPGPVLDKVVEAVVRPEFQRLRSIMQALLPESTSEDTIRRHALSVIGQCNLYLHAQPILFRLFPSLQLDTEEVEELTSHITHVCLAACRAEHKNDA